MNADRRERYIGGAPGHPASEFWAHRHVKEVVTGDGAEKAEFSTKNRAASFFPYGKYQLPRSQPALGPNSKSILRLIALSTCFSYKRWRSQYLRRPSFRKTGGAARRGHDRRQF